MRITPDKARAVAAAIDAYDEDIAMLQEGKRDTFAELRAELEAEGHDRATIKAEVAALKAAIVISAKRRKDDTAEDGEALTDSYVAAIAPRATRTHEEEPSGADTGSPVGAGAPNANRTLVEA